MTVLEHSEGSINGTTIRAKHHLSTLLLSHNHSVPEAQRLAEEARKGKDELLYRHGSYLLPGAGRDEDAIYDHLVHADAGRISTLTVQTMTPKMDEICRVMQKRFVDARLGKGAMSPGYLVQLLRFESDFPTEISCN